MNKQSYYIARSESKKPTSIGFQNYLDKLAANNLIHQSNWNFLNSIYEEIFPKVLENQVSFENEIDIPAKRGANRRKTDSNKLEKVNNDFFNNPGKDFGNLNFYKGEKKEVEVVIED
jgi:hypothetical protein